MARRFESTGEGGGGRPVVPPPHQGGTGSRRGGSDELAKHPHAKAGSPQWSGGQFTHSSSGSGSATLPATKPGTAAKPAKQKPGASSAHTMSRNGRNNDPQAVKELQHLLNTLKIGHVAEDGVFGASTEAAVKDLQGRLGITATGHASPALVRRLNDAAALSPCVKAAGGGALPAPATVTKSPTATDEYVSFLTRLAAGATSLVMREQAHAELHKVGSGLRR